MYKRWVDENQFIVEIKGTSHYLRTTHWIFTSNDNPLKMNRLGDPFWRRFILDPAKQNSRNLSCQLSRLSGNTGTTFNSTGNALVYPPHSTPLNSEDWDAVTKVGQGGIYRVYRDPVTAKRNPNTEPISPLPDNEPLPDSESMDSNDKYDGDEHKPNGR